jgi:hypothetical protein
VRIIHTAAADGVALRRWRPRAPKKLGDLLDRAEELATVASARPYRSTLILIGLNLALAAAFAGAGLLLFSDPAEFFRELMPGTWLSFAELAFIAVTALAIQECVHGDGRLRPLSFWALSAIVFAVFALDEITQLTIFAADGLTALGESAPLGFQDMDAFLLTVLLLAGGAVLLRHAGELFSHPPAVALLAVGVALGAASQGLDSLFPATNGEFVAEESLKLSAEPFLVGGFLVALHRVLSGDATGAR